MSSKAYNIKLSKPKLSVKPRFKPRPKALKRTQSLSFPSSPHNRRFQAEGKVDAAKQHRDSSFCVLPRDQKGGLDDDLERLNHMVEASFKARRSRLQVQLRAIGLSAGRQLSQA
jgi:hypothetical protein